MRRSVVPLALWGLAAGCGGNNPATQAADTAVGPCEEVTWYQDLDGDGYGTNAVIVQDCADAQLAGHSTLSGDCDDATGLVAPGRTEHCNGVDEDCDGLTDEEAVDASVWFADADRDGYGNLDSRVVNCDQPPGYVSDASDCNDDESTAFVGSPEVCDGVDNDCNGVVDDPDQLSVTTYWADEDGDGYGSPENSIASCAQIKGYVENDEDCDDGDAGVSPAVEEICADGADQDCDGVDNSCYAPHLSEEFFPTNSTGQYCGGDAPVNWAYFGELTFQECQETANATGTQWFVGISSSYTEGWIGYQDSYTAVVTSPSSFENEIIVSNLSLYSCALGQVEHRSTPTVSPTEMRYTDDVGRQWVYWEVMSQTHSQAMAFADDRRARIISPNSVGRTGEPWMTAPTHWCYAGAEFNGAGSCNTDNSCNFLVGYWE